LVGCAPVFYPSPYADEGNKVKYKYSFNMLKCDYCHNDTYIYKIVNGKKKMCNVCYRQAQDKIFKFR